MKQAVVAMDRNGGIGADNDLLWQRDLPADLAHFKRLTVGQSVVMGRKTLESIGHALPDRQNIVVTGSEIAMDGIETAPSLEGAYKLARHAIIVIGGAQVYEAAMRDLDRLHVTEVDASFDAATIFFPVINASQWQESSREHHEPDERNKYPYDFVVYDRIQKSPS
jgi:dihydrofolate reductase